MQPPESLSLLNTPMPMLMSGIFWGSYGLWAVVPISDAIRTQPERKGVPIAGDGNNADPLHFGRISVHFQDRVHR